MILAKALDRVRDTRSSAKWPLLLMGGILLDRIQIPALHAELQTLVISSLLGQMKCS